MLARETSLAGDLDVDFMVLGDEQRLPREVELSLYRIAQEALNNVLHHAQAKHAVVSLRFDKEIRLEVNDDGVGFSVPKSPTEFAPSGHFGFLGMRERADLIGGRLDVQSEVGKGTHLSVALTAIPDRKRKKKRE
jgi:signal transduction histidine kinase